MATSSKTAYATPRSAAPRSPAPVGLEARLQQYVGHELPDVQAGFRKSRGTRDQIANIRWIIEKAREFQKNIYFCFIDYGRAFDCVDYNKLWKILKEMGIPDHLTCLWRNLYAGQEVTVRTGHETTDWFQIGKGCILSPCLFNLYQSTSCEMPGWMKQKLESRLPREISIISDMQMTPPIWQKAKKIKSLLMKVKEESKKVGLKLKIQRTKIMASSPITSWQIDGETMETMTDYIFLASKPLQMVTETMKLKDACSLEEKL